MIDPIVSPYINLLHGSEIDWSIQESQGKIHRVQIKCGLCQNVRMANISIIRSAIRKQRSFTGLCGHCLHFEFPPPIVNTSGVHHPNTIDGRNISKEGYVRILLTTLSEEDQVLALPMSHQLSRRSKTNVIKEHRLVMARHLGRPLLRTEIVHHKNGIKTDNRIENLELLTIDTHHSGHGDDIYQQLQEALSENTRLNQILIEHGLA